MALERIDFDQIRSQVAAAVAGRPEVAGAYLFGSALEFCRPDSDIDIALFVKPGLNGRDQDGLAGELALALSPFNRHSFDITVINPTNTLFAFRILSEGKPLVVQNPKILTDFIERISREYSETGFRYQQAAREVQEEAAGYDT